MNELIPPELKLQNWLHRIDWPGLGPAGASPPLGRARSLRGGVAVEMLQTGKSLHHSFGRTQALLPAPDDLLSVLVRPGALT